MPSHYQGYLQEVTKGNHLLGWAWNPKNPDEVLQIAVLVDGVERAVIAADMPRKDLETAGVKGDHGYRLDLGQWLSDGRAHRVETRYLHNNAPLGRSPYEVAGDPNRILTLAGVRIPYDPAIITPTIEGAIQRGGYEKAEVTGTPKFIKPTDRVIELGAGMGFISSYLATTLGVKNILCIEADPKLCKFIARVHALNGITTATIQNCAALNDKRKLKDVPFYIREPFWSSSLDPVGDYVEKVKIPTVRLSKLIKSFKANTLIIDIEGGELSLLSALDLTGIENIYLEVHTDVIHPKGIKKCFDALSRSGFAYDQHVSCGSVILFRRITPQKTT